MHAIFSITWRVYFNFLLLFCCVLLKKYACTLITDENEAREFLHLKDEKFINACFAGQDWSIYFRNKSTDEYAWENFTDPLLRRAFQYLAMMEEIHTLPEEKSLREAHERYLQVFRNLFFLFHNSGVCAYSEEQQEIFDENCTTLHRREIVKNFNKIGNEEERRYYWIAWRDYSRKMRNLFDERVQLSIMLGKGYNNYRVLHYNETSPTIRDDVERAWQELLPFYKELHAFIRRRLLSVYGNKTVNRKGPIPSHLLGLWLEQWWFIKDVVLPYPDEEINVNEIIKRKNMNVMDLFKLAEDFYVSVGLPKVDDNVWSNTHISTDEHCKGKINIKQTCNHTVEGIDGCFTINEHTIHGIFQIFMHIYMGNQKMMPDWPVVITRLPNPAFINALGLLGELSTWTSEYLTQIGFAEEISTDDDQATTRDINLLMKAALRFFTMLPYAHKILIWRWDVYDMKISNENYNKKWWEYSLEHQGVCPPVRRTEEDFDPASSPRVAIDFPILRGFIGTLYSFQFYKAACEKAGHKDMLHRCNLYGEKVLGDQIRNILYLGNSIPPKEAISIMTNGETDKIDTKPILEYFQPLFEWLRKENEEEAVGWESNEPMVCP